MKRRLGKVLLVTLGSLAALAAAFVAVTLLRAERDFPRPGSTLRASSDPALIARGRYLALGPAHCADCHGADENGHTGTADGVALSGGRAFHLPVGTIHTPNITPDAKTGIGRLSDEDLVGILRHGVHPDGRAVLPFMPFANLADDDLVSILSFLRSKPAVEHDVPGHELNLLGKAVLAWVLTPSGPRATPPNTMPPSATAEYGRYLTHEVANCMSCHTKMDMRTGELVGPIFGGGGVHEATDGSKRQFVTPNLTPHRRWGWLEGWTEEAFVNRLGSGSGREGSPMPWRSFAGISEDDAKAIYRYLRTVPAAPGGPDPRDRNPVLLAGQ
jgi:mono/diheme cytochrome c family protein